MIKLKLMRNQVKERHKVPTNAKFFILEYLNLIIVFYDYLRLAIK